MTRAIIANPFRERNRRRHFDVVVNAYFAKNRELVRWDGGRHLGNSIAGFFWRGYDSSLPTTAWDRASKDMMAYVTYRAGQAVKQWEEANALRHQGQ